MKIAKSVIFIITEIVLYGLILSNTGNVAASSYASVILCFVFALTFVKLQPRSIAFCCGLFFTVIADGFLVLKQSDLAVGMVFFLIAQLIYMACVMSYSANGYLRFFQFSLTAVTALILCMCVKTVAGEGAGALERISTVYFAVLGFSTIFMLVNIRKNPLFAVGLALFICCDLVIGLQGLSAFTAFAEGSFGYALTHAPFNLAWLFYLPSQTLIALSLPYGSNACPKKAGVV